MPASKKTTTIKKAVVKKAAPKAEKPAVVKTATKPGSLSVPVFSLAGTSSGILNLPKEIFGEEVNIALLAQAVRVYGTNLQTHWGHTKTRGQVQGSSKKIYRQKGTGGARHGSKRAPIFVHGGIAFGPKYRKTVLDLPKKMKRGALISALSQKVLDGEVMAVEGLEKATGKTKQIVRLMKKMEPKRSVLIIDSQKVDTAARAVRNIQGVSFSAVDNLNAYEIIKHQSVLLTKAAVERLQKTDKETFSSSKAVEAAVKEEKIVKTAKKGAKK